VKQKRRLILNPIEVTIYEGFGTAFAWADRGNIAHSIFSVAFHRMQRPDKTYNVSSMENNLRSPDRNGSAGGCDAAPID